jgi:hypothetical protein
MDPQCQVKNPFRPVAHPMAACAEETLQEVISVLTVPFDQAKCHTFRNHHYKQIDIGRRGGRPIYTTFESCQPQED